ncbi:MAG: hypothetical protein ACJ786_12455 [Catenulispora sp.]
MPCLALAATAVTGPAPPPTKREVCDLLRTTPAGPLGSTAAVFSDLGDRGLRKIDSTGVADFLIRRPGDHYTAADTFAKRRRWGSRLVPYVEGPKRLLKGGQTPSLSCANASEVQVNLDGRIHPKPAPRGGG